MPRPVLSFSLTKKYQYVLADLAKVDRRLTRLRAYAVEFEKLSLIRAEHEETAAAIAATARHIDPAWVPPTEPVTRRHPAFKGLPYGSFTKGALSILRTALKPMSGTELGEAVMAKTFPGRVLTRREINRAATTIAASLRRNPMIEQTGQRPIKFSLRR